MYAVIHHSEDRGNSKNGNSRSYYTFSHDNYYAEDRINFGVMRVLNEEFIGVGDGLDAKHLHNMEIVTIPLEGELEYGDNRGNNSSLKYGDAQYISAGTGIVHNLYNNSHTDMLRYLQIWIYPRQYDQEPVYDKVSLMPGIRGQWQNVVSPNGGENVLSIDQDVWMYMVSLGVSDTIKYEMNDCNNGIYMFILEGVIDIMDYRLATADGIGLYGHGNTLNIESKEESKVLLIELPMDRIGSCW